jgi:hypothetical protein
VTHQEFYEHGLLPGVHYVTVPTAADVPAMVERLKRNDSYARAVAQAGRARLATLDVGAVTDFMAALLGEYAKKQSFTVRPGRGAAPIDCEDDLWRHYARACSVGSNQLRRVPMVAHRTRATHTAAGDRPFLRHFVTEVCVH